MESVFTLSVCDDVSNTWFPLTTSWIASHEINKPDKKVLIYFDMWLEDTKNIYNISMIILVRISLNQFKLFSALENQSTIHLHHHLKMLPQKY